MKNVRIRQEARDNHVPLWKIAEELGLTDYAFSRKLRHELPQEYQEEIIRKIHTITEQED